MYNSITKLGHKFTTEPETNAPATNDTESTENIVSQNNSTEVDTEDSHHPEDSMCLFIRFVWTKFVV